MNNAVFLDIKTESVMPGKVSDLHGDNYEEYRLLGYKNIVRTLEETFYVSATKASRVMTGKI
jgi:hypothetical protein